MASINHNAAFSLVHVSDGKYVLFSFPHELLRIIEENDLFLKKSNNYSLHRTIDLSVAIVQDAKLLIG